MENLELMMVNSYKNFHVKGFDYLCLERSPSYTKKVYFFEGDISHLPEIVNPHDHRYNFKTTILTGVMSNSTYTEDEAGIVYNEFEWKTPLLGGNGFTWKKETRLLEEQRYVYRPGARYFMRADEFHTIRMHADATVLMLEQYEDIVPENIPTKTFMSERQAPNLDGLYEKFGYDQLIKRYNQFKELEKKFIRRV